MFRKNRKAHLIKNKKIVLARKQYLIKECRVMMLHSKIEVNLNTIIILNNVILI